MLRRFTPIVLGAALAAPLLLNSAIAQAAIPGFTEPEDSTGTVSFTNIVGLEVIAAAVLAAGGAIMVVCFGVQGSFNLAKKGWRMLFSRF